MSKRLLQLIESYKLTDALTDFKLDKSDTLKLDELLEEYCYDIISKCQDIIIESDLSDKCYLDAPYTEILSDFLEQWHSRRVDILNSFKFGKCTGMTYTPYKYTNNIVLGLSEGIIYICQSCIRNSSIKILGCLDDPYRTVLDNLNEYWYE